jgi:hypothetical protein
VPSTTAALNALSKKTDAAIAKLDKKEDGFIDEADLKPLMKRLEKATKKMDANSPNMDADLAEPNAKKALLDSRKTMTEGDRISMLIAQGATSAMEDEGLEKVSVKVLQGAVNKHAKAMVKSLKSDAGGIMGGLEKMFAFMLLPDAVLEAALGRSLKPAPVGGAAVDTFER